MNLQFQRFEGAAIQSVFEPLARLRISVFRDFPYLYAGTIAYGQDYLRTYAASDRALLMAVFDGDQLIGASTCIPLSDETPEVQKPFLATEIDVSTVCYFGESILLPHYRGMGLGNLFFDVREEHASRFSNYRLTCFCAVDRPADHPLRPAGYRPLEAFWQKRGYRQRPDLSASFAWTDLGEQAPSYKTMIFWTRPLI